jgi:hypothetical protein
MTDSFNSANVQGTLCVLEYVPYCSTFLEKCAESSTLSTVEASPVFWYYFIVFSLYQVHVAMSPFPLSKQYNGLYVPSRRRQHKLKINQQVNTYTGLAFLKDVGNHEKTAVTHEYL